MFSTTHYRNQLREREQHARMQDARLDRLSGLREAREAIATRKAIGKPTRAMEYTLRYAEANGMTYAGAEHALIVSGRLEAFLQGQGGRELWATEVKHLPGVVRDKFPVPCPALR